MICCVVLNLDLGEFLRTCRASTTPETAGVARPDAAAGRRVRGLRREEVAQLAGVSVDYYTRLEQGRHSTPSDAVVDALARVFQLEPAGRAPPAGPAPPPPPRAPPRPPPPRRPP